jgi:hypothetical protein
MHIVSTVNYVLSEHFNNQTCMYVLIVYVVSSCIFSRMCTVFCEIQNKLNNDIHVKTYTGSPKTIHAVFINKIKLHVLSLFNIHMLQVQYRSGGRGTRKTGNTSHLQYM